MSVFTASAGSPRTVRLLSSVLAVLCAALALVGGWYYSTTLIAGMCLLLSYCVQYLPGVWRWLPSLLCAALMGLSVHLYGLVRIEPPSTYAGLLKVVGSLSVLLGLLLYALRHRDYYRERRALRQTLQAVNIGSERLTQAHTPQQMWQVGSEMLSELGIVSHFALLAHRPEQDVIMLGAGGDFVPFLGLTLPRDMPTEALTLLEPSAQRYWQVLNISGQQKLFGSLVMARGKRPFDKSELTIMRAFVRLLGAQLGQMQALSELRAANDLTLRSLGAALEQRDNETSGHTLRVVSLSLQMTRYLGWNEERIEAMRWGAYLHDLGKIAIPDAILHKRGSLSAEERTVMQSHTLQGYEMLRELLFLPTEALDVVRHHHERWDGAGYPSGLSGQAIPEAARLFSIIDVYDALTSARPYKAAWSDAEAIAELKRQAGQQFDPQYVQLFAEFLQQMPPVALQGHPPRPSDPSALQDYGAMQDYSA